MTTWTLKPSGGDYSTLASALSNASTIDNDTIEISGDWSTRDTATSAEVVDDGITIQTKSGDQARHAGVDNDGSNYALETTSGHCLLVNGDNCIIDGLIFKQAGTGTSDEGIRMANANGTLTVRNGIVWASTNSSAQDGIYSGNCECTINIENTAVFGFNRGGIMCQKFSGSTTGGTYNVNSCSLWDNGKSTGSFGSSGGGVNITTSTAGAGTVTFNIHNTWALENDTGSGDNGDYNEDASGSTTINWNISYSADSDNTIASRDGGGSGNLASRPLRESTSGGDEILVVDITTAPFDLTLIDDDTNNDAQDAHTTDTAEGLTILSTDVAGTSRPQNTSHDLGLFEIVAAGGGFVPYPNPRYGMAGGMQPMSGGMQ